MSEDNKTQDNKTRNDAAQSIARYGKIVFEVDSPKNNCFQWPPTKEILRGRWERGRIASFISTTGLGDMPDIPGMFVELDCRSRSARIYDPLALPQNRGLLENIRRVHKAVFSGADIKPVEDTVSVSDMSNDHIATWLYWTKRAYDGKAITIHEGSPPATIRECFKLGTVTIYHFDPTKEHREMRAKFEREADISFAALR